MRRGASPFEGIEKEKPGVTGKHIMDDMWRQDSAKKKCDSIRLPNANNCNKGNNNENRTGKSK